MTWERRRRMFKAPAYDPVGKAAAHSNCTWMAAFAAMTNGRLGGRYPTIRIAIGQRSTQVARVQGARFREGRVDLAPSYALSYRHGRAGGHPRRHREARSMREWRAKEPAVDVLASKPNGVRYIGVTSDLIDRMAIHKQKLFDGFTKKYGVDRLVYYEMHETMDAAILRETRLKKWKRAWKVRLIAQMNPEWSDLFDERTRRDLRRPRGSGEARRVIGRGWLCGVPACLRHDAAMTK